MGRGALPSSVQQTCVSLGAVGLFYAVGIVAYCISFEQMSLIDAVVFLTTILTTVGFGQPWVPTNRHSKLFTSVFILITCAVGASGFGVLASSVVGDLSQREVAIERRLVRALCWGKRCRRSGAVPSIRGGFGAGNSSTLVAESGGATPSSNVEMRSLEMVELQQDEEAAGGGAASDDELLLRSNRSSSSSGGAVRSRSRRKRALAPLERQLREELRWQRVYFSELLLSLCRSLVFGTLVVLCGAVGFMQVEGDTFASFLDAVYFSVVTAATIGFGDLEPTTMVGKVFVTVYMLLAAGIFAQIMTSAASIWIRHEQGRLRQDVLDKELSVDDLEAMDTEGVGEVSELDFTRHMLASMKLVDARTLSAVALRYRSLEKEKGDESR